jgi:N6-adenosine-specific RNA methylase IME4/ParB-like chromosome segregation protein Spo0J
MPDDQRQPSITDHPLAGLFPLIEGEEFARFKADIAERGLLHPVTTLDGMILDGRNRARACRELGVSVKSIAYRGSDPAGFVIASNLHRRHLDESQRAMVAANLATMRQGERTDLSSIDLRSQTDAAQLLNVSVPSLKRAAAVRDRGIAELGAAVQQGKIAVSAAAKLADLPADVQRQAVAQPTKAKHLAKQHARDRREADLAAATVAASKRVGEQLYGVLYVDPPWRFEPYSRSTGMDRSPDNHYPTMTLSDLREMTLPAADDCVLFLWATVPMLSEALKLIEHWGFTYKSAAFWVKPVAGTGFWYRNRVEPLLVATRGNVAAPAPGQQPPQVHELSVGTHSAKPEAFAEDIEALFPNVPKLEMFARRPRPGWDIWGNEA